MEDPYVYKGTNILINKLNLKDQNKLDEFEGAMVTLALVRLQETPFIINSSKDILRIHEFLFDRVYDFAGKIRTININKTEPILNGLSVNYSNFKLIEKELDNLDKEYLSIKWNELDKKNLVNKLTKYICSLWQIHPFREGNTRCVCMYLYLFVKQIGLKLNVDFIGKHAKYFRNALVMGSIGEYSEYNHLGMMLEDSISIKIIEGLDSKYQTINEYNVEKYKYNYHTKRD